MLVLGESKAAPRHGPEVLFSAFGLTADGKLMLRGRLHLIFSSLSGYWESEGVYRGKTGKDGEGRSRDDVRWPWKVEEVQLGGRIRFRSMRQQQGSV